MAGSVRLRVYASFGEVRTVLERALQSEGFSVTWTNTAEGVIEKGSKIKALFFGAFSTHYKYRVVLHTQRTSTVVVDLGLATRGISGGAVGIAKVHRKLDELGQVLVTAFQGAAVFIHN